MKKLLVILTALILTVCALFALTSCFGTAEDDDTFKVGFIFLHGENSTYDKNFMDAAKAVQAELGLTNDQVLFEINIEEGPGCYEAAKRLVNKGCDVVFADSFGHEDYMIQAATEFPDVQFCHATGTKAHTTDLPNFHNAFASIYEGRFVAGIVAGMKLQEMIDAGDFTAEEAKIGYVGAMPYAEVISGYTSFYLGVRSIVPEATMEVVYTHTWYNEALEKDAAVALIENGCKLISQHADSWGAPTACEDAGIPNVAYNGSTISAAPETYLISSRINWAPYFKYMIESVQNGTAIVDDYCGGFDTGSVALTDLNTAAFEDADAVQAAIDAAVAAFKAGTLDVFDTAKFTVGDNALTADFKADVDSDANYAPDTKVVIDGIFEESKFRSAPYFNIIIDGITVPKDTK